MPQLTTDAARARYALLPREEVPLEVKRQRADRNRAKCSPRVLFRDGATAMGTTPRYVVEGGTVQQTVTLFRDARAAKRAFDRMDSPANRRCIARYTYDEIDAHTEEPVRPLENQILNIEALGQQSTAYRLSVTVVSGDVASDILINRVQRSLSSVSVTWKTIPADLAFQEELVARIAARLERTLPS